MEQKLWIHQTLRADWPDSLYSQTQPNIKRVWFSEANIFKWYNQPLLIIKLPDVDLIIKQEGNSLGWPVASEF